MLENYNILPDVKQLSISLIQKNNSLQTKFEAGMWLDTPAFTDEYRQHMIGSYQKTITASEIWYDKDGATKEKMEGTAIK